MDNFPEDERSLLELIRKTLNESGDIDSTDLTGRDASSILTIRFPTGAEYLITALRSK
jgi:hypothetical protein